MDHVFTALWLKGSSVLRVISSCLVGVYSFHFAFRSVFHFELIFVDSVRPVCRLCTCGCLFVPAPFVRETIFGLLHLPFLLCQISALTTFNGLFVCYERYLVF